MEQSGEMDKAISVCIFIPKMQNIFLKSYSQQQLHNLSLILYDLSRGGYGISRWESRPGLGRQYRSGRQPLTRALSAETYAQTKQLGPVGEFADADGAP